MYLGIDIGGTTIKTGILTEDYLLTDYTSYPTNSYLGPEKLQRYILEIINSIMLERKNIDSIGIGVPGVVDLAGKVIQAPNLSGWENIEFGKFLSSNLKLPFKLENDANAAAWAEMKLGAGKSFESFIYVTLGTGVGGAIIFDGKLFRGTLGGAGEFGHLIINPDDRNSSIPQYRQGVLEEYVGRLGIIRLAKYLFDKFPDAEIDTRNLDVHHIVDYANKGNAIAIEVLQETGYLIGLSLAGIMNILDIPIAVIGGGISKSGPLLFDAIKQTVSRRALPSIATRSQILQAKFDSETGVIGAALLGRASVPEASTRLSRQ